MTSGLPARAASPHTKSVPPGDKELNSGMRRLRPATALLLGMAMGGAAGCAHPQSGAPAGPSQHFQTEANHIDGVKFEDDFIEARLIFQALPMGVPERTALRQSLLRYLLDPIVALSADQLRREVRDLENDDIYDRIFESFRDALSFYEPSELWAAIHAPRSPRPSKTCWRARPSWCSRCSRRAGPIRRSRWRWRRWPPSNPRRGSGRDRLSELIRWTEEAGAAGDGSGFRRPTTSADVLESAFGDWPSPALASPLDSLYGERQKKFVSVLRRPLNGGESSRKALGDLLLAHGDEMQRVVVNVRLALRRLIDRGVRLQHLLAHQARGDLLVAALVDVVGPHAGEDLLHLGDDHGGRHAARHFARVVAAHAVGEHHQAVRRRRRRSSPRCASAPCPGRCSWRSRGSG